MNDLQLIVELMRRDTDALGFIPKPDLERRWLRTGRFLIQRDNQNKRIGYLLHGPVHRDGRLHVHQVCIDVDRRRRRSATDVLNHLVERARQAGAQRVLLNCATDLAAIEFWLSIGAIPTLLREGGKRRQRTIQRFEMPISSKPALQFRSCGPFGPPLDPKHLPPSRPIASL